MGGKKIGVRSDVFFTFYSLLPYSQENLTFCMSLNKKGLRGHEKKIIFFSFP
ncbi:MAG: hypothetical protein AB1422_17245 [bacterium]